MADALAIFAIFASLFSIVNPIGTAPVFLALTPGYTPEERRHVALRAALVAGGVLIFFGLAGEYVFRIFGVTIPAFRIAGGILIFKYAFDMLQGHRASADGRDQELANLEKESVGITPLGVPLLTGPGAIATIIVFLADTPASMHPWIYAMAILAILASYLILLAAARLDRALSPAALMVATRLMGLILAAVAVQFVANGATAFAEQVLSQRG